MSVKYQGAGLILVLIGTPGNNKEYGYYCTNVDKAENDPGSARS